MEQTQRSQRLDSSDNREILETIQGFQDKNILVIGDSILDHFIHSNAAGLSLETPTLLAEPQKEEFLWGGAGNVVENLLELGAKVGFLTLLGDKDSHHFLDHTYENLSLYAVIDPRRKTTVKSRFFVKKGNTIYKHLELHKLNNFPINKESEQKVLEILKEKISDYNTVLVVDQAENNNGMMSDKLIEEVKKLCKENKKILIVNSQVFRRKPNHAKYSGADIISLNVKEAKEILPEFSFERINELSGVLNSNICLTLGSEGSILYLNGKLYKEQGIKIEEVDSCGAGDSFLSAFSLSNPLKNPGLALKIGNIWAGLSATKLGTSILEKQELIEYITSIK